MAGRRLGDYELIEEIARGGMGVVYRARQRSLNRIVAVKILLGGGFADETYVERFRREAEAAASLNHPNIVAIHEVSDYEEQPFFSMELIEGCSLADLVRENPLPARRAAQLLKTIAEAVHFAHKRGLLHRDLKPSNVLVDAFDAPHITDFGVAKRFGENRDLTLSGEVVGSPNYMPPEQADTANGPATAASDVYSLGAILYHALTGRPPFMAETVQCTLRRMMEGDPVSPRLLNPSVSRDLETICLKCLEKSPGDRYASAQELSDELARFLRDEPIRARPISPAARLARWCRRKPALALFIGTTITLMLVVVFGAPIAIYRIGGERDSAEAARIRAESARHETQRQLYVALLEQARATVRSGESGQRVQALYAIRSAGGISNSAELRREAVAALALPDLRFERDLQPGAGVTLKALDPAFARIALSRGHGPVEIRSVSNWGLLATLPASTNLPVHIAWWSLDGRYLAVKRDYPPSGERAELEVWELPAGRRVFRLRDLSKNAVSFHPHEHWLTAAQVDGTVIHWDLEHGQEVAKLHLSGTPIRLKCGPDGKQFAVVCRKPDATGYSVSIHDTATGAEKVSQISSSLVRDLDWHPSGSFIVTGDSEGRVHLMDTQDGGLRLLGQHKAEAVTTVFSADGDYLITGGWERELICWDVRTKRRAFTIGQESWVAQFRSDGRQCAVMTESGVQLYAFERPIHRELVEDLGTRLKHASFSSDGRWLAASGGRYLGVWDLIHGGPGCLTAKGAEVRPTFTADGQNLFGSRSDHESFQWRMSTNGNSTVAPTLEPIEIPQPEASGCLALTPTVIAFTGSHGSRIGSSEDISTAKGSWTRTSQGINGISPDGQWLGIYSRYSPVLHMYRLPGFEEVARLTNQANIIRLGFSPSGSEVAVATRRGVEFWSAHTWRRDRTVTNAIDILFSPGGHTCWLTRDLRAAGLYDLRTLESLLPLPAGMLPLAVSPDGRNLAVSVDGRRLQIWDIDDVRNRLRDLGVDWKADEPIR